jgi:putative MFS transporter
VNPLPADQQPLWLRWLPFAAYTPTLSARQWRILGLVVLVSMTATYAVALLQLALPQIQASLAIPAHEVSGWIALIRLGALPASLLTLAADRLGRRRLLLLALLAFSLLTGASALAPTIAGFALFQFLLRTFTVTGALLASVVIVEEFPEDARGWGIGVHSAVASLGGGLAAVLFAGVEIVPYGWRALYLLGAVGVLGVIPLYYYLPETSRFQAQVGRAALRSSPTRLFHPLRRLLIAYPGRFASLGLLVFLYNVGIDAALFYDPTYLQQAHGWQPWQVALLNLGAGFNAVLGSAAAGRWSDRFGRKRTLLLFLLALPLFVLGYFNLGGLWLPVLWAGMVFTGVGLGVALGAYSAELFPTAYRATATGATANVATLGGVLSLTLHGLSLPWVGSPWSAVSLLTLLVFVTPLLLIGLPETSGRTLEEIAPEEESRA